MIEAHVNVLDVLVGQVHDYHQVHFDAYVLTVFVPWVAETSMDCLFAQALTRTGSLDARKVVAVHETNAEVQIVLADGTSITIDVRPSSWSASDQWRTEFLRRMNRLLARSSGGQSLAGLTEHATKPATIQARKTTGAIDGMRSGPEAMMLSRGEECMCVWNE
jgi:hypothetical protein